MPVTILSSRAFNRGTGAAKRAAADGPVFITDRGKFAYVLLRIEEYRRLNGEKRRIADALAMPGVADLALDPPRAAIGLRLPDLA